MNNKKKFKNVRYYILLLDKLAWSRSIVKVIIPNQLCNEYKLGIAGLVNKGLNRCEFKVARPAINTYYTTKKNCMLVF
jgi:hypothetical protein